MVKLLLRILISDESLGKISLNLHTIKPSGDINTEENKLVQH